MDITGRDLNFFLKAFSAKDVALVNAGKLLESFEEEYEDKRVSCMIYENSSMYTDPSNNLQYGASLSEDKIENGAIYVVKYYFYNSANYTLDLKNLKKGKIEGFPLLSDMKGNDGYTPFFGLPVSSVSVGKEEYWLELQNSDDSTEIRIAVFQGNDFGYAELASDTSISKKGYKAEITKSIEKLVKKGKG